MIATFPKQEQESKTKKTLRLPPELQAAMRIEKRGPVMIDLAAIAPSDNNPRQDFGPDEELQALAASLTSLSLLAPLTVTPLADEPGAYSIVAGERRWRAAKLAGFRKIPCYVVTGPPEVLAEMTLSENLLRKDLNTLEVARALELMTRLKSAGGLGLSRIEAGERLGKSGPWVCRVLPVLKLPAEWQRKIVAGELHDRSAWSLAAYADRPEILAAVALDVAQNPDSWSSAAKFDASLAAVVSCIDAAANSPAGDENPASLPREALGKTTAEALARSRSLVVPARRSAPVRHDQADVGQPDPVAAIVGLIKQLETAAQCERVERALVARQAELVRVRKPK